MSVTCTVCGKLSEDAEFCDHCNSDLLPPAQRLPPALCPLPEGDVQLDEDQRRALQHADAYGLVEAGARVWRVRWITESQVPACHARLDARSAVGCPCLAHGQLRPDHGGSWLFIPAAPPWTPWIMAPDIDSNERLERIRTALSQLATAFEALHDAGLVCLTFTPAGIEETEGRLRFVNLDLELFPAGLLPERISAHANYAAPEIAAFRAEEVGTRSDVFHLAIFAYYWLAGLLPEGFPGSGLDSFDYQIPFLRVYAPRLPEGLWTVVRRGLAHDPTDRFESPGAFVTAFATAIERARGRRAFEGPIRWDAGGVTRVGRAKGALGWDNEDQCVVKNFADEGATLVAVADGVSTCQVGSGGLASLMAMVVVEATFAFGSGHDRFPEQAAYACGRGAQSLLDWAMEKGYRQQLQRGADLMGTTLTLGWIQDRHISLANLGDSRAYLITEDLCEQLTVDGDLSSALLGRRADPAEVKELGMVGRALRECIGGCIVTKEGEVVPLPESSRPALSKWPLLPGDVLVLCTDGLVEEGIFLEPQALAELVRANRHQSAKELAQTLVDAADALQLVPGPGDPDGLGDNITCVVVKIEE